MAFRLPGTSGANFGMAPGSTGGITPTAPAIISPLTANGTVGTPFSYWITATGMPTSYSATGLPAGLTVNSMGRISGTPTTPATTNVTIGATNSLGTDTQTLVITIAAALPVITSPLTASGTINAAFSYQIAASNAPTSFAANVPPPVGLTVNTMTGLISGTPTVTGSTSVTISATNSAGTSAPRNLVISIAAANVPVITSALIYSVAPGGTVNYQIAASNAPTSFAATGLPSGVTVNTTTGLISGTAPMTQGSTNVTLTATNANGTSPPATLVFTIAPSTAWEVTYLFPSPPTVFSLTNQGRIPLVNWTGWNPAYAADMSDALYDILTPAAMPVNLYATFAGQPEVQVTFDNFGGTAAPNKITAWGYTAGDVYIGGSNGTGNPIQLRLEKT